MCKLEKLNLFLDNYNLILGPHSAVLRADSWWGRGPLCDARVEFMLAVSKVNVSPLPQSQGVTGIRLEAFPSPFVPGLVLSECCQWLG